MTARLLSGGPAAGLDLTTPRRFSYARLAVTDAVMLLGGVSVLCAVVGVFDDAGDAVFLLAGGLFAVGIGALARRTLDRKLRPAPGRILSGLALSWLVLVVLGTGVYLGTGTIDRVDDAFVESAAGFSTTALTTLDPTGLSVPMALWRAGTQWVGGLIGILVGVIALPLAFRGSISAGGEADVNAQRLAPTLPIGRRRVVSIYLGLTAALGLAYAAAGLGALDSAVHAMTTISTGGFSTHTDSFAGFGTAARSVAIVGMVIGGSSFFLVWWVVRGRLSPLWRSTELRVYVALLVVGSVLVGLGSDGMDAGEVVFATTAAVTTTGFAVGDWTTQHDSVLMILLLLIGTGAMSASAGGGLRVSRAWTLVGYASRELRRQLDPHSIVVVKQAGSAVDERTLERTTGYQIGHLAVCGLAAFLLATAGVDVVAAIYTGISVVSTNGPGVGPGPFGDLSDFSPAARLLLTPFMLAGRMTILPLLLAAAYVVRMEQTTSRRIRRILSRRTAR